MAKNETPETKSQEPSAPLKESAKTPPPDAAFVAASYHLSGGQPYLSLQVFMASNKRKPDQLAGFAHWAKKAHPGKYTRAEWEAHLDAFNRQPVR